MSVYSCVPVLIMACCSILIILTFRKMNQEYLKLSINHNYKFNKKNYLKKIKKNRQICLMVLNSNLYFLLSMLQFWLCFYFYGKNSEETENVIQLYVYIFVYTNNAVDFMIYGISSSRYRRELIAIFKPKSMLHKKSIKSNRSNKSTNSTKLT
jgi:hypothetical protein